MRIAKVRLVFILASTVAIVACGAAQPAPSTRLPATVATSTAAAVSSVPTQPVESTVAPTTTPEATIILDEASPEGGAVSGALAIPLRKVQRVPKDVPMHMSLALGGGGGPEDCIDVKQAPVDENPPPRESVLTSGRITWCYCQLTEPAGQTVTATLAMADGAGVPIGSDTYQGFDQNTCVEFWYTFQQYPERRPHTFTVQLSDRSIVDRFVPHLGEFEFRDFQANEPVRVIVYAALGETPAPEFVADQRTQADGDGVLRVDAAGAPGEATRAILVYAVGQTTPCRMYVTAMPMKAPMDRCDGDAGSKMNDPIRTWTYDSPSPIMLYWRACPNSPRSELHAGDTAAVIFGLEKLPAYFEPTSSSQVAGELLKAEPVKVLEGPQCAEGVVWWRVEGQSGVTGWVIERKDESSANVMP